MSEIYLEILDPKRQSVFDKLAAFDEIGYLAGGTALALQLKHRKSYDFDIFVNKPLTRQFFHKVTSVLGSQVKPRVNTADLLLLNTENNIQVDFVHYWYKLLQPTIKTSSIQLATIEDIATDKAHTIGHRGAWRDYVDVFILLKNKRIQLKQLIKLAQQKFGSEFAPHLFLQQLTYYKDLPNYAIEFITDSYSDDEIKKFLVETVKTYHQKEIEKV